MTRGLAPSCTTHMYLGARATHDYRMPRLRLRCDEKEARGHAGAAPQGRAVCGGGIELGMGSVGHAKGGRDHCHALHKGVDGGEFEEPLGVEAARRKRLCDAFDACRRVGRGPR